MKRALMYASVASMIQQFNIDNIRLLQELGYEVDVACNFEFGSSISDERVEIFKKELETLNVKYYHIPVPRNLHDIKHLIVSLYASLKLMNEKRYCLIHCHSPIGGMICRIANRMSCSYEKTCMIYTAHGFHFFKGNNVIKNIIFKTMEKIGARYTDTLITINKEDYRAAKTFKLKKEGFVFYVPGIGINLEKFEKFSGKREQLLRELHIPSEAKLLFSVGELNQNKNHRIVVEALANLKKDVHYLIAGQGDMKQALLELATQLDVQEQFHLLGYRNDIIEIMKSCDVFVFPSKREGLSVALMEAMACGLPCVVSEIRGNTDLIDNEKGGYIFKDAKQVDGLVNSILNSELSGCSMSHYNLTKIKKFSRNEVEKKMKLIYSEVK